MKYKYYHCKYVYIQCVLLEYGNLYFCNFFLYNTIFFQIGHKQEQPKYENIRRNTICKINFQNWLSQFMKNINFRYLKDNTNQNSLKYFVINMKKLSRAYEADIYSWKYYLSENTEIYFKVHSIRDTALFCSTSVLPDTMPLRALLFGNNRSSYLAVALSRT